MKTKAGLTAAEASDQARFTPALRAQYASGLRNAIAEAFGNGEHQEKKDVPGQDFDGGESGPTGSRRAKLWQIDAKHYCSLLGICLGLDELRQLSDKLGISAAESLTDYQLHHRFLQIAGAGDKYSRRLHRHVETKFSVSVRAFVSVRGVADLKRVWEERATEDLAGAYWAVLTHPSLTPELANEALERVHMFSHTAAAQIRRVQINLQHQRERVRELEERVEHERAARTRLIKRYRALRERLTRLMHFRVEKLTAQHSNSSRPKAPRDYRSEAILRLETKLARAEQEAVLWRRLYRRRMEDSLTDNSLSKRDRVRVTVTNDPEPVMERAISPIAREGELLPHDGDDVSIDLQGRRIICVGGHGHVIPQLRALTEGFNGRFYHHDGGIEDRRGILDDSISVGDVVVVALERVSHDATRRLKRRCRQVGTQIVWMRRASADAFEKALRNHLANASLDGKPA